MAEGIVLESVWVAVGFVVFVALVWRKVGAALGTMLDERSQKISDELEEAATLRDEALAIAKLSKTEPRGRRRSKGDYQSRRGVCTAYPGNS